MPNTFQYNITCLYSCKFLNSIYIHTNLSWNIQFIGNSIYINYHIKVLTFTQLCIIWITCVLLQPNKLMNITYQHLNTNDITYLFSFATFHHITLHYQFESNHSLSFISTLNLFNQFTWSFACYQQTNILFIHV